VKFEGWNWLFYFLVLKCIYIRNWLFYLLVLKCIYIIFSSPFRFIKSYSYSHFGHIFIKCIFIFIILLLHHNMVRKAHQMFLFFLKPIARCVPTVAASANSSSCSNVAILEFIYHTTQTWNHAANSWYGNRQLNAKSWYSNRQLNALWQVQWGWATPHYNLREMPSIADDH